MQEMDVGDGVERSCTAATPSALEQSAPAAVAQVLTFGEGAARAQLEVGIGAPLRTGSLRPDENLGCLPVACPDGPTIERNQSITERLVLTRATHAWATTVDEGRQGGKVGSGLARIRQAMGLEGNG
jgi:hypothetical protein